MLSLKRQLGMVQPLSFTYTQTACQMLDLHQRRIDIEDAHSTGVNSLDIESVEQRYLLTGSGKGSLAIHDLGSTLNPVHGSIKAVCTIERNSRYAHAFSVDTVQWYPFDTGMFTSSGMDGKLKIWDSVTIKPADTFSLMRKIYCHHMSPVSSSACVAVAMDHPHVVLVDMKTGSQCHQLCGHKGKVMYTQWSPMAEHLLASCGTDGKILLWDVRSSKSFLCSLDQHNGQAQSNKKEMVTAHNGYINSIRFTPDGLFLLSFGNDGQVRLWDVAKGRNTLVNYGYCHNDYQKGLKIDVCYNSGAPLAFLPSRGKIAVYELFSGARLMVLVGHFGPVFCVQFRSFVHELYSCGNDHNIILWDTDISKEMPTDNEEQENWSD